MDNKIANIEKAIKISGQLHNKGKTLVLAGGCFDILHIGHITFLEKARLAGDKLFVLLESDDSIKKIKGESRPINHQEDRAEILSALSSVDVVILLKPELTDRDYEEMILKLKPDLIAITKGDKNKIKKSIQAKKINSRLIEVTSVISDRSTSRLINLLGEDL